MFKILRYYSISSFFIIFLVMLAIISIFYFYRQTTINEFIELDESRNAVLTQAFANSIWPRFASYVTSMPDASGDQLRARPETAEIREAVITLMRDIPVLKVKIYNLSGLTVFSTDERDIGVRNVSNKALLAAAREGLVSGDVTHRGKINVFDRELQNRDVLESYIPIRSRDGRVEAVFELYFDVTDLLHIIDQVQMKVLFGLLFGFGLIYGGLFLIVRRGDKILNKQYAELLRGKEQIKVNNEELNREITERKQVENALRVAKRDTERANSATSKFLAMASHDLRQPLYAMSLFLPLLSKRITDSKSQEFIDSIWGACDDMQGLLYAVLDISKLDAGFLRPDIGAVMAESFFQKLGAEFAPQAREKGLELCVVPANVAVATDPALLRRILRNLLSNAIQHTTEGRVLFGARRRGPSLRFEIWDTGIGIAEDKFDDIFQEFFQIGNRERDRARARGLGLGLAVVARLSRLLGHRIEVRSTLGRGSVFSIEVPMTSEMVQPLSYDRETLHPAPSDLEGVLVVLVEDDPAVFEGTRSTLENWRCRVVGATTIESALETVGKCDRSPDLILADYRLQGEETGVMAIEQIRRFVGSPIPAVLITGDTDPERIREAAQNRYPVIHKPIESELLHATIRAEL